MDYNDNLIKYKLLLFDKRTCACKRRDVAGMAVISSLIAINV